MRALKVSSAGGVGICEVVGIVFVILKLLKVIDWSWWWVTVPFWGPFVLVGITIAVTCIVMGIRDRIERKRRRYS